MERALCCISLPLLVRLLGITIVGIFSVNLAFMVQLSASGSPWRYVSYCVFLVYAAPAIAFTMMLLHKEDLRSRKRFHCAYLCSVVTNCIFRLFFVIMVATYYSFYLQFGIYHSENRGNPLSPTSLRIMLVSALLVIELGFETLIRKRLLVCLESHYKNVDDTQDEEFLRALVQEDDQGSQASRRSSATHTSVGHA